MTDQLDQPDVDEIETSADEAPPTPDASIEAVMKRLDETLDKRFSGFQSLMDRKVGNLETQLGSLRRSTLTQEEVEAEDQTSTSQEIERLRMENQLLQLRVAHPEAVDLIMGAMATESIEDQVAFIESKMGKKAITQIEEAVENDADEITPAEVDPTNPRSKPRLGPKAAAFGGVTSMEEADAILDVAGKGSMQGL